MILLHNNKRVGTVTSNRFLTIKEALYALGYDVTVKEDLEKAYNEGAEWVYVSDEGNYNYDFENMQIVSDEWYQEHLNSKIPVERTLFQNYDICVYDENIIDLLDEGEELTENEMWEQRYAYSQDDYEMFIDEIKDFFNHITDYNGLSDKVIFFGSLGRWDGRYDGGEIGDFYDLYRKATEDCDYIEFKDVNGHLYLRCSHHDGTHHFEIKVLTKKGVDYYDRWLYSGSDDTRTKREVHNQVIKRYSHLPHFYHRYIGGKKTEYYTIK